MWKRIGKALLVIVAVLVAIATWKREDLERLNAVNTLFAPDRIVWNFSHMDQLFHVVSIPVQGVPEPLPDGPEMPMPTGWQDWLTRRAVTGIVVLKDGAVVHEDYLMGTGALDLRISWSMAKSYLSGLFGILLDHGDVASLDDPVVKYAPALKGSAYEGATIRNVLQMASGVDFNEDYLDFWSDINKMGRVLALGGSMDDFAAGLDRHHAEPGREWHYVSIDTHVLGMVARGATGRTLPDLLAEHILTPLGTQGDPYYLADGYGVAFALGGLNLTTLDYARMGELFRNEGRFQGRQIIPQNWVQESTEPLTATSENAWRYGYQWWIAADAREGEFMARGVYGQYVFVDKQAGVVVAVNAADRGFENLDAEPDALAMFRAIVRQAEEM